MRFVINGVLHILYVRREAENGYEDGGLWSAGRSSFVLVDTVMCVYGIRLAPLTVLGARRVYSGDRKLTHTECASFSWVLFHSLTREQYCEIIRKRDS